MSTFLSAHAAAVRLGVSDRTIRRWIASGKLDADKAAGEFRIALEDLDSLTGQDEAYAAAPHTQGSRLDAASAAADLSSLVAFIERQQALLIERTEVAAMWQERAHVLGEQLALTALPSPPDASTATHSAGLSQAPHVSWRSPWLAGIAAGWLVVVTSMVVMLAR
jgi:excisionase family DNA binding protein